MFKNGEKNDLSDKIRANIISSSNSNQNGYINNNNMNISSSSTKNTVSSTSKDLNHISHSGISEKKRSSFAIPIKNPYWPDNLWKEGSGSLIYSYKHPEKCLGPPNTNKSDKTIRFNSRFESGNLLYAYKLNPDVYHCIIDADHSPSEQCQWFYFQMSNIQTLQNFNRKITFYISGFTKETSIISNGWKVFMYSEKLSRAKNISWFRTGTNYAYGRSFKQDSFYNGENKSSRRKKQKNNHINSKCYTLQFQITFPYDDDVVYLCYGIPYTFSDLNSNITRWTQSTSSLMTCTTLCKTRTGKSCPILTITAPNSPKTIKKRYIFLTARNHPGESNSSLILHGLIDYLFSKQQSSEFLLHHFIFKIVPMINVDGVIDGSHHIGPDGENMNRNWSNPDPYKHPVIYHIKNLMNQIQKENGIDVFIDFHGCSSEHGTFLLGCPYTDDDNLPISCINKEKIFPKILDSLCDSFSLDKCHFPLPRRRNEQPRSVVRKEFGVVNSFTLKSSFGGSNDGIWSNSLYSECNWKEIGAKVAESLFHLLSVDKPSYLLKSVENSKTFSNSSSPKSKSANSSFEYSDSYRNSPVKMNSKEEILAEMKRKAEADEDATVIAIETEDGIKVISGNSNINSKINPKNESNSNSNLNSSQKSNSFYNSDSNSGFSRLGFRSESSSNSSFSLNSSSNSNSNSSFSLRNRVGLNSESSSAPNPRTKSIRNTNNNYSSSSISDSKNSSNTKSSLSSYLASRNNYSANSNPKPADSNTKTITVTKSTSLLSSGSDSKSNSNLFLSTDSNSSSRFNSTSKFNTNTDQNYNSKATTITSNYNTNIRPKLNSETNSDYNSSQSKRNPSPKNSYSTTDYKSNEQSKRSPSPKNSSINTDSNFSPKKNLSSRYGSNIRTKLNSDSNSDAKPNSSTKYSPSPRSNINLSTDSNFSPNQSSTSKYSSNIRSKFGENSNTDIQPSLSSKYNSSPRSNYGSNINSESKQQNVTSRIYSSPKPVKTESNSELKQQSVTSRIYSSPKPVKTESNSESKPPSLTTKIYSSPKPVKSESSSDAKPSLLSKFNSSSDSNSGLIQRPNSSLKSSSNYSSTSRPISRTKLSSEPSDLQQSENNSFLNANECTSSWSSFQSNSTASFPSATSFKSPFTTSNKRVTFQSDIYQKVTPKKRKSSSKDS